MAKTAQQSAERWNRGMQGAGPAYTNGVNGVTENPATKAIAAIPKQVQKVQEAAASGKTAAALGRVTLQDWKTAAISKGAARLTGGAAAALPKFTQFMQSWMPHVNGVAAQVNAMPNMTLEDGIARATAQIRGNAGFKRS